MIELWVVSFSLILARAGTFVAIVPVLGGANVPKMVKIGLAFALATLWFCSLGAGAGRDILELQGRVQAVALTLALGREMILGGVFGYALGLFLVPVHVAGEYLAQEMGLSLAAMVDPLVGKTASPLTQVLEMLATAIFFALDGHHVFLTVLHTSLLRWPPGSALPRLPVAAMVQGAASAQEWGLVLAAPVGVCLFLTSAVMALMARAVPQMNVWSLGFALRVTVGLGATMILLPQMGAVLVNIIGRFGDFVLRLV